MIENLPQYIPLIFGLTTLATLWLFYRAINGSTEKRANIVLVILVLWLALQALLTLKGVYNSDTTSIPPRIVLFGVLPPLITIVLLFATGKGREFLDSLPLVNLTYIHIIRIPVELVLLWLFMYKAFPQLMTFEGRNFDIVAGITAPFIAYWGLRKSKLHKSVVIIWNIVCLGLLLNIVVNALLSAPTPFQCFAFDQPNIAIFNFPFSWLPTFIVPVILLSHLVSIRKLSVKGKTNKIK